MIYGLINFFCFGWESTPLTLTIRSHLQNYYDALLGSDGLRSLLVNSASRVAQIYQVPKLVIERLI